MNEQEFCRAFGKRIREIREIQGLSVYELAKKSKIGKSTIYRIECGEINVRTSTIIKLARAFEYKVSEIFDF